MSKRVYSNSQKATLNTVTNIALKLIALFSAFITKTIMIKSLGIEYAGLSSLFSDILTVFSFAELGIGSAIIFELYKPIQEKDYRKIAQLMNFYKRAYQTIGLGILIVGLSLIPVLPSLVSNVPNVHEDLTIIYTFYVLNTVISYFLIYQASLLTASQENYIISFIQGITSILRLIIGSFILLVFHNFLLYLFLDICLLVIQNILVYMIADKKFLEIRRFKNETLPKQEKKVLFGNVGALALYQVSNVILNSTDSIVISTIIGTGAVGLFSNYRLIIRSVDNFLSQITVSITPTLGNLAISQNNNQYKIFIHVNFLVYYLTMNSSLLLYFLTEPFIHLWLGEKYIMSQTLLLGFVSDFFLLNMIRPVASFRNANGMFTQGKYRPLVMSIMNIVFSIVFVKYFGMSGVIWGTAISRLLTQVWFDPAIVYKHIFKKRIIPYFINLILQILLTVLIGIIIEWVIIALSLNSPSVLNLVLKTIVILVISNLIFLFCFRKNDEFKVVIELVKRYLKR
ncbi:hypothetical protein [Enterococcus casseliflavus]|uniref:hypothetical protein n=1 Tax=Enterococcus casseliflavus TaxID=37734 RepID=UPI001BCA98B4|nr:hypothetical protein [Enterococcus casseliflavus]